eukprot:gene46-4296_t
MKTSYLPNYSKYADYFYVLEMFTEVKVFIFMVPFIHQRQIFFTSLNSFLPSGFHVSPENDFVLFNFLYLEIVLICCQIFDFWIYFSEQKLEPVKNEPIKSNDSLLKELQRKLEESETKIKTVTQDFKSNESKLIEVVENLTLKCSIYESFICEVRPETSIQELREKVREAEKSRLNPENKGTPNLEEFLISSSRPNTFRSKTHSLIEQNSDEKLEILTPKNRSKSAFDPDFTEGMKIVGQNLTKKKVVEVQVIEGDDSDDDDTERDFNENDMNQMLSESVGEKKNKEVAFSEKILNSLTVGIKVAMKTPKQKDFLIKQPGKQNFQFASFGNDSFSKLRNAAGIDDDQFIKSICDSNMKVIITPGKSGALLFFTADKKFVLKTVSVTERKFLEKILKSYEKHVVSRPSTTIVRLLALYKITINKASIQLVVMENVFPVKPKTVYDLKGSSIGRNATLEEKESGGILKDNDLLQSDTRIRISSEFKKQFMENLTEDCEFLSKHEIMDYSMLLGVQPYEETEDNSMIGTKTKFTHLISQDGKQQYHLGIIDILQKWNLKKKAEVKYKVNLLQNDKKKLSAMPPKEYANRFLSFMVGTFGSK